MRSNARRAAGSSSTSRFAAPHDGTHLVGDDRGPVGLDRVEHERVGRAEATHDRHDGVSQHVVDVVGRRSESGGPQSTSGERPGLVAQQPVEHLTTIDRSCRVAGAVHTSPPDGVATRVARRRIHRDLTSTPSEKCWRRDVTSRRRSATRCHISASAISNPVSGHDRRPSWDASPLGHPIQHPHPEETAMSPTDKNPPQEAHPQEGHAGPDGIADRPPLRPARPFRIDGVDGRRRDRRLRPTARRPAGRRSRRPLHPGPVRQRGSPRRWVAKRSRSPRWHPSTPPPSSPVAAPRCSTPPPG